MAIHRESHLGGLIDRVEPASNLSGDWVWAVAHHAPNPAQDPHARPTGRIWFVYEPTGHTWTIGEFTYVAHLEERHAGGPVAIPAERLYAYGVAVGPIHVADDEETAPQPGRASLSRLLADLSHGTIRHVPPGAYNFFVNVDLERLQTQDEPNAKVDLYVGRTPEAWRQPQVPPPPERGVLFAWDQA